MRVRVSCATKFHAFALSEQLEKNGILDRFYTLYYSRKNTLLQKFHGRRDNENIPVKAVKTFSFYLPIFYKWNNFYKRAQVYDWLVEQHLKKDKNYDCFIGWSGMSLRSALQAKKDGKLVIIERGSSHIQFQYEILKEEYLKFGKQLEFDQNTLRQELKEYEIADYISIPSGFVYNSFLIKNFPKEKLVVNNYGVSNFFSPSERKDKKFRILYLGGLTIRKGLLYLFQALNSLKITESEYEVWFIGSISEEIQQILPRFKKSNWDFFGHINHYNLANYISQCDVAVHPSIEEGLSMVIPQIMACGVPVIATINTGGADLIEDGTNGYIIPIRNPQIIAEKIEILFDDNKHLHAIKQEALSTVSKNLSWDDYGLRYSNFLKNQIQALS